METEPHACIEIETHATVFMVNVASGVHCKHGAIRQKATTSHNMVAILPLID